MEKRIVKVIVEGSDSNKETALKALLTGKDIFTEVLESLDNEQMKQVAKSVHYELYKRAGLSF